MAKNKKGFMLYADLIHTLDKLPNETAGTLFKHILYYVNDLNPTCDDLIINVAFEPIKQQLKRDLKHWESVKEKRSFAGKESANKRQHMLTHVESVQQNSTQSTVIVNDNVNVIVNDNVIIDTNVSKFNFKKSLIEFGSEENLACEWMEVRKKKKATNTETALKTFIKEVNKSGKSLNEILTLCISKDWKGFEAKWLTEQPNKKLSISEFVNNMS